MNRTKPGKCTNNRSPHWEPIGEKFQIASEVPAAAVENPSHPSKQILALVAVAPSGSTGPVFANKKLKKIGFDKFLTLQHRFNCNNHQCRPKLPIAKKNEFV